MIADRGNQLVCALSVLVVGHADLVNSEIDILISNEFQPDITDVDLIGHWPVEGTAPVRKLAYFQADNIFELPHPPLNHPMIRRLLLVASLCFQVESLGVELNDYLHQPSIISYGYHRPFGRAGWDELC